MENRNEKKMSVKLFSASLIKIQSYYWTPGKAENENCKSDKTVKYQETISNGKTLLLEW